MYRHYYITSVAFLALLLAGCRRPTALPETLDAHYVDYRIEYLEEMAGDIPTRILPESMEAYYTDYFVLTKIEGFFNQFSLIQIADLKRRKVTTLLNFFGNKVYHAGEQDQLPVGVRTPGTMRYRHTRDTAVIGGLRSERIEVDTGGGAFDIYCTGDFVVRRPNISTPYHNIPFPLSDFRVRLSALKMHLTCREYRVKTVKSEIFTVPEDYRRVERAAMEHIINSLFTKE